MGRSNERHELYLINGPKTHIQHKIIAVNQ